MDQKRTSFHWFAEVMIKCAGTLAGTPDEKQCEEAFRNYVASLNPEEHKIFLRVWKHNASQTKS